MIQVKNIDFSYGRRKAPIFTGFDLELRAGRVYGLLGKNGTGKSTLLYLMAGLLRPQRGEVLTNGWLAVERRPEMLQDIFFVPEEFFLPNVSLQAYVRSMASLYPRFNIALLAECLAEFGLPETLQLGTLSMGQKKKVLMSIALASGCRILLMDEPTNGLDIPSKSVFRKVVARCMTDERLMVLSTHQVRDVEMLLDHVVMIEGTRLLLDRSMNDIAAAVRVEERPTSASTADALMVQPSLQGNLVLVPAEGETDESVVNLELVFCCAEQGKLPASLYGASSSEEV